MMTLKSYAKINLHLNVISRYENGYHAIDSIFNQINLYDTLNFEETDSNVPQICGCNDIPLKNNLIYKAIVAIQSTMKNVPFQIKVNVKKNIPQGGGLGGGSSNAAVVLMTLNKIYNLQYSKSELTKIGVKLGADVPYFIYGGWCQVGGIGEIVRPIESKATLDLLVVLPAIHIDTAGEYAKIDQNGLCLQTDSQVAMIETALRGLKNNNFEEICGGVFNKFEFIAFKQYTILQKIKSDLIDFGAFSAFMSGSGSTMVGIFRSEQEATTAKAKMTELGYNCIVTSTI